MAVCAAQAEAAAELYCYGHCNVMFKPTKAAEYQFRPSVRNRDARTHARCLTVRLR